MGVEMIRLLFCVALAGVLAPGPASAQTPASAPPAGSAPIDLEGLERVAIAAAGAGGASITAYLGRPAATGPVPVVIAMHGCGGLITRDGRLQARERDWLQRWTAAGYAVLMPDSFNSRGLREICSVPAAQRTIRAVDRATDVRAAVDWLAGQAFVDKQRLALVGWSHGGSTTLAAVRRGRGAEAADLKTAIAFYPGCGVPARAAAKQQWAARLPLTILIGSDDDWTPAASCRELARLTGIRLLEYPGAVHGFDAPNSPRRTRTGLGVSARGDGRAEVGTDPVARARAIEEVTRILAEAFR